MYTSRASIGDTLLEHAKNLYCSPDVSTAAVHIKNIQGLELFPPGLPNQSNQAQYPILHATTLDRVLATLYASSKKFPDNKNHIEQTVIQWNFCSVVDNGRFYDHSIINNRLVRSPSVESELNWHGFESFGLIDQQTTTDRFDFTTPYKTSLIKPLSDIRLLKTYIKHCLPHPDDEHLYRSRGRNFISRIVPMAPRNKNAVDKTSFECTPLDTIDKPIQQAVPKLQKLTEHSDNSPSQPTTLPPIAAAKPFAAADTKPVTTPVTSPVKSVIVATDNSTIKQVSNPINPKDQVSTQQFIATPAIEEPSLAMVASGSPSSSAVTPTNIKSSKGLSGSITLDNKGFDKDRTSLNLALAYKPFPDSFWFVRSAFNVSFQGEPINYSWGIGYDDWHTGTWAVQLNHWGPLTSGDGLDIDNAVAEISYKLKSNWLKDNNLSSTIGWSRPVKGNPSMSWGLAWQPYSNWFVRSTLSRTYDTEELNWSYGFGYTQYTASSISLEYNNWGVNEFPQTNFKKNAQVSLIYRWAY